MDAEIKFCKNCGAKVSKSAKFCGNCGYQFEVLPQVDPEPVISVKHCPQCGNEMAITAKFCRHCGYKVGEQKDAATPQMQKKETPAPEAVAASVPDPSKVQASSQPGEVPVLEFFTESVVKRPMAAAMDGGAQIIGDVTEVTEIKSAFSTIGGSIMSTLGGSLSLIIKPKYLILAVLMALVWIVPGSMRDSSSALVKFLSWLTFAKGGFDRDGLWTLGGIVGKSVVGVTLCSFFTGGIPKAFKGLGAAFTRTSGKKSILALIAGFFTGIIGYFSFVGFDAADITTSMAGISGALLSFEALGGRSGMLYDIAESLTSKKIDGIRMAQDGKANSLLTGLSFGFLLITLFAAISA